MNIEEWVCGCLSDYPNKNISVEECITKTYEFIKYNEATNVPIYLYNKSALKENRVVLPSIRKASLKE